jgi:hypothetical protein
MGLRLSAYALTAVVACGTGAGENDVHAGLTANDAALSSLSSCKARRPCDDGLACTKDDTCIDGVCKGTPYSCDDNNPCTADACDGAGGCTHMPISGSCNDGNSCTTNDTCVAGVCQGTVPAEICGNGIDDDCDGLVDQADADCVARPNAPSQTDARPALGGGIQITWVDNATNEDGFRVERSLDAGATWEVRATIARNGVLARDSGVTFEQEACYRVVAFNALGDSPPSNIDCTAFPKVPTDLRAVAVGSAIELTWTDNSSVEDSYELWRYDGTAAWAVLVRLPANTTGYRDTAVAADVTYQYTAMAKRDGWAYWQSNQANAVIATVPPAAPGQVNATPYGSTAVGLLWADQSTNEEGFRVERSTDGGATWETDGTTPYAASDTVESGGDSGRTPEQEVCYRAFAYNSKGDSPPSEMGCTTPPAAPTNLTATATAEGVLLTWTDNSAVEDGYSVELVIDCLEQPDYWISLPANSTSYLDTSGVWCYGPPLNYYVQATKGSGYSDLSNPAY